MPTDGSNQHDPPTTPPQPTVVDNTSLWERIAAISASVPPEEWDSVPTDGSVRHDAYLPQR